MAEFQQKPNQGSLFRNDRKATPNQPDYTGTININGQTKRIAGWVKVSQGGTQFLSIQISDFQEQTHIGGADFDKEKRIRQERAKQAAAQAPAPEPVNENTEDDLPF